MMWTWWGMDFADERGDVAGFVRLAVPTAGEHAVFWAYLLVPRHGIPERRTVVVRDHAVPRPRQGLEIRADGLWAELVCETPDEHWTFGLEAFGVALDDPLGAPVDSFGAEIGDRTAVGFDLEWETQRSPDPVGRRVAAERSRPGEWEAPRVVHGEILVARDRIPFTGGGVLVLGEGAWPPADPSTSWCVGPAVIGTGVPDAQPVAAVRIPLDDGRALIRTLVRGNGSVGWTTALTD
jgi:hypothetical protein